MKPGDVESLLARARPGPEPEGLAGRILEEAERRRRSGERSRRRTRFSGRLTVAAAALVLVATLAWLVGNPFSGGLPSQETEPHGFDEKKLEVLPHGYLVDSFSWSRDGKHWAFTVQTAQGPLRPEASAFAVVDGKKGELFDWVTAPAFGTDGRFAYRAHRGERTVLVRDRREYQDYEGYESLAWSPDGQTLAYVGLKAGKEFVVSGDRVGQPFDEARELCWSPDGRTLAYAARIDEDWFVVLGDKKGEIFDAVKNLTWSPDGKTLAYGASEGRWMMVVGQDKGEGFEDVGPPVFSPDGRRVAYPAVVGNAWFMVAAAVTRDMASEVGPAVFSRDGKVMAYRLERVGGKACVMVYRDVARLIPQKGEPPGAPQKVEAFEGLEGDLFDQASDPVVNPDGSIVAYAAARGKRWYLVVGDKLTKKFSLIDRIRFGPDGKTLAYRAGQYGKQLVVAGEARSEEFDGILTGPVFSADGKKVAFVARQGQELWSKTLEVR